MLNSPSMNSDEVVRFWTHVNKSDGCWEWTGCILPWPNTERKQRFGYGQFRLTKRRITVLAHRYSYVLTYGPIPPGLQVCHKCDNPKCVRPDHLFVGTASDNKQDSMNKGRHPTQQGRCNYLPKGKDHHYYHRGPKLDRETALIIRRSPDPQHVLAKRYGVVNSMISLIKSNKTWIE